MRLKWFHHPSIHQIIHPSIHPSSINATIHCQMSLTWKALATQVTHCWHVNQGRKALRQVLGMVSRRFGGRLTEHIVNGALFFKVDVQ
jgi:hypothetical protein